MIYIGTFVVFAIYIILQALPNTHTYLYVHDTSIFYQQREVDKIKNLFHDEFAYVWDWFVDNNLSIYFGEDKTKLILFSIMDKNLSELNKYIWQNTLC